MSSQFILENLNMLKRSTERSPDSMALITKTEVDNLIQHITNLEKRITDYSWETNPERMGR